MTLTLILLLSVRTAHRASIHHRRACKLVRTAQPDMWTTTVMRLRSAWSAVRVGMLERGARCAMRVLKADTMVTQMPQLPASIALPGTTLHQGLPAVTSVQRVSMTLTPILQLSAWTAQPASTRQ